MIISSRASQPGEPPDHERHLEICMSKKDNHSIKPLILKAVPAAWDPYLTGWLLLKVGLAEQSVE